MTDEKRDLEAERDGFNQGTEVGYQYRIAANPAAILDLIETLDRAVEVIKFYGDKENWYMSEGDLQVITNHDLSKVKRRFDTKDCGGKLARDFIASLEGGVK